MKNLRLRAGHAVSLLLSILMLCSLMAPAAFAVEGVVTEAPSEVAPAICYPTAITRSEDGTEIRKMYDLSRSDDPAGIPRYDFEQYGFSYTLTDLLKQELPEHESRQHTEKVSVASKSKDMGSILALLPQEREFITDDGLVGVLSLQLDTVDVKVAGYGSSTKALNATRTYPNLSNQDTSAIPKSIEDGGHTLTLEAINWQRAGDVGQDGTERFTAIASYSGSTTSSYVKGYTVTADYTGTVSRVNMDKVRYVAIFEGTALEKEESPEVSPTPSPVTDGEQDKTAAPGSTDEQPGQNTPAPSGVLIMGIIVLVIVAALVILFIKRRKQDD